MGESPATTWFHKLSKHRSTGFKFMLQAQHGGGKGSCLGPSDAHNTDAATAGRSRHSDNGVVEVHGEIVAGEGSLRGQPAS